MSYSKMDHPQLLYNGAPKLIEAVLERRPIRYQPKNRTVNPGDIIDFDITSDQFADLGSAVLHFDLALNVAAGTTDTGARIHNALDIIKQIEVFYNDQSCERVLDANVWANTFLSYSATRDWANSEGGALLGLHNQGTASAAVSGTSNTHNGIRSYAVPLAYVSGFFRMKPFLPLVNNKLRLALLTEAVAQVIGLQSTAIGGYQLTNTSLVMDMIVVDRSYSQAVQKAMLSEDGFRIPYTSFQTAHATVTGTTDNYIRVSNNNSNALSLFILHEPTKAFAVDVWTAWKQCFPMPLFTTLRCTSGSKTFTPADGIRGFPELYASAEKCVSGPADLSGQGWIDYKTFTATYAKHILMTNAAAAYGLCVMAVNLEKSIQVDDAAANNGLDSHSGGADQFLDVQITTSSALDPTSTFLTNLVHRRALVFRQGASVIES
jgi:hypothetical protein